MVLKSALPIVAILTVTTTKEIIQVIENRAMTMWGEKAWKAKLAQATIEIIRRTDPEATYEKRRRQIYNVFSTYSCSVETLFALLEAVGCRLQLICTETKVIDL